MGRAAAEEIRELRARKGFDANASSAGGAVQGTNGELVIGDQKIPVENLTKVLGSRDRKVNGSDCVEAVYTIESGHTVRETYEKDGSGWSPVRIANGERRQITVSSGRGAEMVALGDDAFAVVDVFGRPNFVLGDYDAESAVRDAFSNELAQHGNVTSLAGGDGMAVLLQENEDGERTLSTIRWWSEPDEGGANGKNVGTRVTSTPVTPDVAEVFYQRNRSEVSDLNTSIKLRSGDDRITDVSLFDVERASEKYRDARPVRQPRRKQPDYGSSPPWETRVPPTPESRPW